MLDFQSKHWVDDEVFDTIERVLVLNMHEISAAGQSETKQTVVAVIVDRLPGTYRSC
jgi:hypothetical protein